MFLNKKECKYFKYKFKYNSLKNTFAKGGTPGSSEIEIILQSGDTKELKVDWEIAQLSWTITSLVPMEEDEKGNDIPNLTHHIPLPPVESNILELIIKFCTSYHENKEKGDDNMNKLYNDFTNQLDDQTLIDVVLAVNYLDIRILFDLLLRTLIERLKAKQNNQIFYDLIFYNVWYNNNFIDKVYFTDDNPDFTFIRFKNIYPTTLVRLNVSNASSNYLNEGKEVIEIIINEKIYSMDRNNFAPYSPFIASGSRDSTIKIWDPTTGECMQTLESHTDFVMSVAWNENWIASGSWDKTIKIWNSITGDCIHTLRGHVNCVQSVAWNSNLIASGSNDSTIKIWNSTTGECIHTLTGHTSWIYSVAWNGNIIASGSYDKTIKIWNSTTGEYIYTLEGHTGGIMSVEWNGIMIASGSFDSTIKIWNSTTRECIHTLEGHSEPVNSVVWNSDLIASGSNDLTIKIWDSTSGECIQTLKDHFSYVRSVAWNGNMIVSGSYDSTIKIWNSTTGKCIQTLEGHVKRIDSVTWNK